MNIKETLKLAQEMQGKIQQKLGEISVESSVGGGIVTVRMDGHKNLLRVKINPEAMDPEDPGLLEDLIVSATNEAVRKVDEALREQIGSMAPGIPGLF